MPKRSSDRRAARAALGALAIAVALPCDLASQAFYKWTDKDGKVQYGDQPPKKFDGPVTRIEIDTKANTRPMAVLPRTDAQAAEEGPPQQPDIARKRRELRAQLDERVKLARAKLEAAKAALDDAGTPQDEERQVVQRRFDKPQAGRSNCRTVKGADGKNVVICPALVPSEAYYDRMKALEQAVKSAEDELEAAELAYRRGVD